LVHVSDLSWTKRVSHPKEMLQKGDEVEAMILNVDEQNRRIALGVKQLLDDPWDDIAKKYKLDTVSEGIVTNITNFGMFIELEKNLEGLLHVSEIELGEGGRMEDIYKTGDPVTVKVIHVDGVQKKIALTLKGLDVKETPEPAEEESRESDDETQKEDEPGSAEPVSQVEGDIGVKEDQPVD